MTATVSSAPSTPVSHEGAEDPASRTTQRIGLGALLVGTGLLYLWGLDESGWGNSFYAAAAQAGSESWTAFFFGASDAGASITVDKTPMSVWVMALSVRTFGLSSWSVLVPQALMGVATVAVLHASVRRSTGSFGAGLLAGGVLALTPVAVLMFRFDNPDALLVLLLVGAAAATLRATETGQRHPVRWLVLAGVLVGCGFMTKMLQAFLVLPAMGLAYLLAAHTSLPRRLAHLGAAAAATLAASGWWIAVVELWPGTRPYVGGSQTDSVLELGLGYNGLGRLTGDEPGSVGGGMGWGDPGLFRLLDAENGGGIAWLIPAALVLLVAGLWATRRRPRTDRTRAALVLWGTWLLVTGLVFSLMAGIFHAYYSVALAPAVGAIVGIGAALLWARRGGLGAALTLAAALAGSAALAFVLLGRTPDFHPWLRWVVVGLAALGVAALVMPALAGRRLGRRTGSAVAGLVIAAGLLGPAAYALDTAATPHTGSIPSAGPAASAVPGRGPGGGFGGGPPALLDGGAAGNRQGAPPNGFGGAGGGLGGGPGGGPGGGGGGLLDATEPSAELTRLLESDAAWYTWVAATVGAQNAAGYQLATERSVMPIGGFNGSDPSPTLEEFQEYVAAGRIHWFIGSREGGTGGGFGGGNGTGRGALGPDGGSASEISAWVEETFPGTTIDGVTMYDLSGGAS